MGFCRESIGRISIETRSESFRIHPTYGYDDTGNEHSDELGSFGVQWRESAHPEFLYDDLDDLIAALQEVSDERASEAAHQSRFGQRPASSSSPLV